MVPVLLWNPPRWAVQHRPLVSPQRGTEICTSSCFSCRGKCAAPLRGLSITASVFSKRWGKGGKSQGCVCPWWGGNGYFRNCSDFHWQLPTIYSSSLGFPPLSFTFTVLRVMSLLYQDDKVHSSCAPGAQLSATAQNSSWHFLNNPWCITARGCALHSSVGFQHRTIKKAGRVEFGCLKHSICASPSSLDRHS